MSHDKSDDKRHRKSLESEFDVFRRDGATRLPNQQFQAAAFETTERSGPVEPRILKDIHDAPPAIVKPLHETDFQETAPEVNLGNTSEPLTVRLETYSVDLAARIARVKSEQKDALDGLQHLQDESADESNDKT